MDYRINGCQQYDVFGPVLAESLMQMAVPAVNVVLEHYGPPDARAGC